MDKAVYVMRGSSGSGKSVAARKIRDAVRAAGKRSIICSADDYFYDVVWRDDDCTIEYEFCATELHNAHLSCQKKFTGAVSDSYDAIIIDNTNTTEAEVATYAIPAWKAGYRVEIIEPEWRSHKAEELAARNVHGVPIDVIDRQMLACDQPIDLEGLKARFAGKEACHVDSQSR